jgi:hypothetical protein
MTSKCHSTGRNHGSRELLSRGRSNVAHHGSVSSLTVLRPPIKAPKPNSFLQVKKQAAIQSISAKAHHSTWNFWSRSNGAHHKQRRLVLDKGRDRRPVHCWMKAVRRSSVPRPRNGTLPCTRTTQLKLAREPKESDAWRPSRVLKTVQLLVVLRTVARFRNHYAVHQLLMQVQEELRRSGLCERYAAPAQGPHPDAGRRGC